MRNWTGCSGVYSNMRCVSLFLICSLAVWAQRPQQQDPLEATVQAAWQARSEGHFADAAAAREKARTLLQTAPAASTQFAGWAQQVAQLYEQSGMSGQGRAILQEALDRAAPLGESHPSHIALLSALGESWRLDGNLLNAAGYLERAAAAQATAPQAAAQPASRGGLFLASRVSLSGWFAGGGSGGAINAYMRLADLYQQMGRPDAVAAIGVKISNLGSNDRMAVARFDEQHGKLDDAAAIYRELAEQSTDPQAKVGAWQSLAALDARQKQFAGAIDAIQQAIAVAPASAEPGNPGQSFWLRQNLATYLHNAGQLDQADQVYQQLVQESRGGPQENQALNAYAQYLGSTNRASQGESLLETYLADNSNADPWQRTNILYGLSTLFRTSGDAKNADAYQHEAQALQPQPPPPPAGQIRIGEELQKAVTAANQKHPDDAYRLAVDAIQNAAQAVDGHQISWQVPQIANALAANKQPARADQLFQQLFALAQGQKVETLQPLMTAAENYERFLANWPDRSGEVPAAIERYRSVLTEARGADSASLVEPLRMTVQFERSRSEWKKAENSAGKLLELQESLSGNTSEPYLGDLQTAARIYDSAGDTASALPLFRKAITIADLLADPNNVWRRAQTRMDAAMALAHLGQFDEAETLAQEAVALQAPGAPMTPQLAQIRQMKQAAATASANRVQK